MIFINRSIRVLAAMLVCGELTLISAQNTEPEEKDFTPDFVAQCKVKAEQGDAEAQAIYGRALSNGWGVETNHQAAVSWLQKAAMAGNAMGQCALGICYIAGKGVAKDEAKAVEWYRKAAEQGLPRAQCNLGGCYEYGFGVEKNEVKAVEWYRKAAEQGYAQAQCNLGVCYECGRGVAKDETKAVEWYRKAAEQGDRSAQFNLGICYEFSRGVEKDETKAVEWYRKAVEQQYADAERRLSICYAEGRGVEKDEAKAIDLMRRSADHGNSWAQYSLGRCSEYGFLGQKRDTRNAIKLYLKADKNGFSAADLYYKLGNLYWNGAPSSDFQRNEDKAIEYWQTAADVGEEHAKTLVEAMETNAGWNAPFDHSSLVPDTKIDSFAGFTFGGGGISEDDEKQLGLEKTEDMHLIKKGKKKNPFRKMDGIELFFTPKTRETYGVRLFVEWPHSTFDSREAAFVECIATRETITRRYGVLPEYQAKDKQNDNVTNGPWGAPSNPVFALPDSFSYKWKLEGVTIVLSIDGWYISLMATDDELAEIAENERKSLLKKAKEQATQNDGGDML